MNARVAVFVCTRERHALGKLNRAVASDLDLHAIRVELGTPNRVLVVSRVTLVEGNELPTDEIAVELC